MVKLRCGGCRGGFRSKYCNIAKCATEKGFEGCWECSKVEGCKEFEFLEGDARRCNTKNLKNISETGVDEWADGPALVSAPAKSSKPPCLKK